MLGIMAAGLIIKTIYDPIELHRPIVGQVEAKQPVQSIVEPQTIEEKVKATFGKDGDKAWKMITECENKSVDPKAVHHNSNGTWDAGLMQINQVHGYSMEWLFDVDNNLKAAKKIYDRQGFRPWSCSYIIGIKPFYVK